MIVDRRLDFLDLSMLVPLQNSAIFITWPLSQVKLQKYSINMGEQGKVTYNLLGRKGRNFIKVCLGKVSKGDGYLNLSRNLKLQSRIHWMWHWWAGASWSEATLDETSIPEVFVRLHQNKTNQATALPAIWILEHIQQSCKLQLWGAYLKISKGDQIFTKALSKL